jgi:sugar lactone lactonase YvrE
MGNFLFSARAADSYSWVGIAGSPTNSGTADGTGSIARFNYPYGIAADGSGNLYVADQLSHTIRKVTPAGVVTTFAGSPGNFGSTDGSGSAARFNRPAGLAMDGSGNLYVLYWGRSCVFICN